MISKPANEKRNSNVELQTACSSLKGGEKVGHSAHSKKRERPRKI